MEMQETALTLQSASAPIRSGDSAFTTCAKGLAESSDPTPLERAIDRIVRKGLSRDDAQDIAYDTLLKVCEAHARSSKRDIKQYYDKSIRYAITDRYKRNCRYVDTRDGMEQRCTFNPKDPNELRAIHRAFGALSDQDQTIVTFAYIEGYSHREIAARLNLSEGGSRKRLQRATKQLRSVYGRGAR